MNRDVIKNYKKEFDAWLEGGDVQVSRYEDFSAICNINEYHCWDGESAFKFYRIKPKTRLINGVECPLPLVKLDSFETVFISRLDHSNLAFKTDCRHCLAKNAFQYGLVFSIEQDAITTAKAILKGLKI